MSLSPIIWQIYNGSLDPGTYIFYIQIKHISYIHRMENRWSNSKMKIATEMEWGMEECRWSGPPKCGFWNFTSEARNAYSGVNCLVSSPSVSSQCRIAKLPSIFEPTQHPGGCEFSGESRWSNYGMNRGSCFIYSKHAKSERNLDIYHTFAIFGYVQPKKNLPRLRNFSFSAYLQ